MGVGEERARLVQELTLVLDADTWKTLVLPEGVLRVADFGELEGFVENTETGPLPVETPETGKVLVLSGALPPSEVSVKLRVKGG